MTHHLFSYGTLQQPEVQRSLFGRELDGRKDTLPGYELARLAITDPEVARLSGTDDHPIARFTGRPGDHVDGTVLTLTDDDLAAADDYEVDDYDRALVPLKSGLRAWVFGVHVRPGSASGAAAPGR